MRNQSKKIKEGIAPKADLLFEVSWEAGNKVGGIYAVLASKVKEMISYYNSDYYLVGPYLQDKLKGEFQEQTPPVLFKELFLSLEKERGIRCHFGRWLIPNEPFLILVDFQDIWKEVNQIKARLWEDYQIDSLNAGPDFNEPVVWAQAAAELLQKICLSVKKKKIAVQFHEWLSAASLLYLKKTATPIASIFTTHATTLGRTLAYHSINFYSGIDSLKAEEEAVKYNIKAKHQLEKAAACASDVFTTVSEITGLEAQHFLSRKPDVILPNGLGADSLLSFEELTIQHRRQREHLREFLLFYFFSYYTFDLENTLFYFISGRYEWRAKGIDIFIQALAELNRRLIKEKSKKTVVTFFWIPAAVRNVKAEILENREFFQEIKDSLEEVSWETKEKILYTLSEGKKISEHNLFSDDFLFDIKKKLLKAHRQGQPPLCTHDLTDEANDLILKSLKEFGLQNRNTDKVKVVFYPTYLNGHDGLSNLNYQQSIQACHLGIFPSFYEPWGYTPMEAAATGVAAVTTDLSGFGRFCQTLRLENQKQPGIFVLKRFNQDDHAVVRSLADTMFDFAEYTHRERVENKIQARKIAALCDWQALIEHYIKAHNLAVGRVLTREEN